MIPRIIRSTLMACAAVLCALGLPIAANADTLSASASALDGQPLIFNFTFSDPTNSGGMDSWSVYATWAGTTLNGNDSSDYAVIPGVTEARVIGVPAGTANATYTMTISDTGWNDLDGDSWTFNYSGTYILWDDLKDKSVGSGALQVQGTLADTPEPSTIELWMIAASVLFAARFRRQTQP